MSGIELLLFIVSGLFFIVLFWHIQLKKQIRHLSKQMEALTRGNSEKMLDISLIDKDLERLAGILNQYHAVQRQTVSKALGHEENQKESIANISHDLRTPLTVILGHLQLLMKENLEEGQLQRIKIIRNKAERMKELAEAFYELSILDERRIAPQKEDFNFSNLFINLITEYAPVLEGKGILPEIDLPDSSIYLYSDRNMAERILQNLLSNAIRYADGTIKVTLRKKDGNGMFLTIENPVQDCPDIDAARLFDRFYTGDPSRHDGSTGLGLAVARTLVLALGGRISADVRAGRFCIMVEL